MSNGNGNGKRSLRSRVTILETKMEALIGLNKWQLGVMSAIFVTILAAWATRR